MSENVKELIEEIKNQTSLMLDLAYSSVFFENKEIAKEVITLHNQIGELEEDLYLHLFAASRGRQTKRLISIIDIIESAKLVAHAAKNMSEIVLRGEELHPIIKEALWESDETIVRSMIKGRSILKDRTIGDLRVRTEVGIDLIAIKRKDKWIFDPKKITQLEEKDIIIGIGPKESCRKFHRLCAGEVRKL